ncbi:hypothetical protein BG58_35830 [Caballeronia jiangsuensis]|nr:hypothetical protein BG58_35830 [Caballeronia jiangsuensis]
MQSARRHGSGAQVVFLLKLFEIEQNVMRTFHRADQLIELDLCRRRVAVPRVWIRKPIRNVTTVVDMLSCQVSL